MSLPSDNPPEVKLLIDHLFRREYGRVVAYLTSIFGVEMLPAMEDIAQETLLEAYQNWSFGEVPAEPARWIFKVAKNKALNYCKREQKKNRVFEKFYANLSPPQEEEHFLDREIRDSMLRMIFACATPHLTDENKILLVLNTLSGFTRKEIANALLMDEETLKKRLYRIKKKIRSLGIKFEVPTGDLLEQRIETVLSCLYLLFNEGYNSSNNDALIRKDLCLEAARLTKLLAEHFPDIKRINALLALFCFHIARFDSRIDAQGTIVLISHQDRSSWNRQLIDHGDYYLARSASGNQLSSYHLEAAIAAEYCHTKYFAHTNWKRIDTLYTKLMEIKPSPLIQLNLAIVRNQMGETHQAILDLLDLAGKHKRIAKYYLFHAALGEMYRQNGDLKRAKIHLRKAKSLTRSSKEHGLLSAKMSLI